MAKCKNCGKKYARPKYARSFERWCSAECGLALARAKQEKRRHSLRLVSKKTPQQERSHALQLAEKAARRYVRARDRGQPCISCGASVVEVESGPRLTGGHWDAGHYLGKGARPRLRLDTLNIHRQCKVCNGGQNRYRSTARVETVQLGYRRRLVLKIGEELVEQLEGPDPPGPDWDLEYLERYRKIMNRRALRLEKLNN